MVIAVSGQKTELGLGELTKWLNLLIGCGKQEKEAMIGQLPLELAVVEFCGKMEIKEPEVKEMPVSQVSVVSEEYKIENDTGPQAIGIEEVENGWGKLMMAVKPFNHSVEAFLRAARPHSVKGKVVTVEVFYPFHKDKLEELKNKQIVELGIKQVWGVEVEFKCILGKDKKPPLMINNDTPMSEVTGEEKKKDMYDVAKEIFG